MFTLITELAGLAAVGYLGLLGSTVGTIPATARALQLFVALAGAMLFFQPLAAIIDPLLASIVGRDFSSTPWSLFLAFLMLYSLFMAVVVIVTPPDVTTPVADSEQLPRAERVGGGLAGGVAGLLAVGTALIALSILPLPGWLHVRTNAMYYDLGAVCIRAMTPFVGRFAVYGEPLADNSGKSSSGEGGAPVHLSSEVWADVDGDGVRGDADIYVDRDKSGSFSEKQPYLDSDNDFQRRVGLLEKYAVWCWDDFNLQITNVGPTPPPGSPEEEERPAPVKTRAAPAGAADEDIPGGKADAPVEEQAESKDEEAKEEPSDDF